MASRKSIPLAERFWIHVEKTDGCWLWRGARRHKYGKVRIYRGFRSYHEVFAHRAAWELAYGPIPADLCVCHRCDVPLCVRPDHLFLGTRTDNLADMTAKGRRARGEAGAAKLTDRQVINIRETPMKRGDQTRMAKELGLSHATLSLVRSGKTWKHLLGASALAWVLLSCVASAQSHTDVVVSVKQNLQERRIDVTGSCGAWEITKRVAFRLQAEGAGVLQKTSGNNCEGYSVDSIVYPDGKLFDILIDAGGANGPAWQPNGIVDPMRRVVIALNPDVIVSTPAPIENEDIEGRLIAMDRMLHEIQVQQAVLLDTLLKLRQAAIDQGKALITVIKSTKK